MTNKELEMKLLLLGWKLRVSKFFLLVSIHTQTKTVNIPERHVSTWKPRIVYYYDKGLHYYANSVTMNHFTRDAYCNKIVELIQEVIKNEQGRV